MTTLAADYSSARPDPAKLKAAGYSAVMRYLAPVNPSTKPKILTAQEAAALHHAGLSIGLVWEWTAGRAEGGPAIGALDRHTAEAMAHALGVPTDVPIFYAVDSDVNPTAVMNYFEGIQQSNSYRVGVYGSKRVVEAILTKGLAHFGWQTQAWNGNVVSTKPGVVLYQRLKLTTKWTGGGIDEDVILRPFPLWLARVPAPRPEPTPTPTPKPPAPGNPDHDLWAAAQKWAKAKGLT